MGKQKPERLVLVSALLILSLPLATSAQEPEVKRTRLNVEVTLGDPPEPVPSAEVFVISVVEDSEFEETAPTNRQGVARFSGVPRGKVLVQVTARGCKNFGKRYELNQESQTIQIKLEKLPDQSETALHQPHESNLAESSAMRDALIGAKSTITNSRAFGSRMPFSTKSRAFPGWPLM